MLKPNVTQTDFTTELLINNAQGECIANVQCSWSKYHHSIPATFHHADESETTVDDLNIEFYTISDDGEFEISISNEQIPHTIYYPIVEHLEKYGDDMPDLVMSDIEDFWDISIFPNMTDN